MKAKSVFVHDYQLPRKFAGRIEQLSRLVSIARDQVDPQSGKRPSVIAVSGIGGIGKSCLLRRLIEDVESSSRYSRIVWYSLYLSRSDDVIEAFRSILTALNAPFDGTGSDGLAMARRLERLLREELVRTPTLIVLDGLEVIQCDEPSSADFGRIVPAFEEIQRFLEYTCAQSISSVYLSTRLRLTDLEGMTSYLEMPLDYFSVEEGIQLLRDLEVRGDRKALENCVTACGGHALSLVAAGRYFTWKGVSAGKMESLTGDIELFRHSPEGQKIKRILDKFRAGLTAEQEYFLVMLSLHKRAVTGTEFPALVKDYSGIEEAVWKEIVFPLERLGLLEVHVSRTTREINAHPLIKLAASTWIDASGRRNAHRNWAEAATRRPFDSILSDARELADLQPALSAVRHYVEADDYEQAWRFYANFLRGPLYHLGYAKIQLELLKSFSHAAKEGTYEPHDGGLSITIGLTMAYSQLEDSEESLRLLQMIVDKLPQYRKKTRWPDEEYEERNALYRDFLTQSYISLGRVAEAKAAGGKGEHIAGLFLLISGRYRMASRKFQKLLGIWLCEESEHQANNLSVWLAESLIRSGLSKEALSVLAPREEISSGGHLHCCLPNILAEAVHANLRLGNVKEARVLEDRRMKLEQETDRPAEESTRMMLCEGRYEEAIGATVEKLSTRLEDKLDKAGEIRALIVRAHAWHALGENSRARQDIRSAADLMKRYSFHRYRDEFKATSRLVAGRG